eukprot:SAG31_NODE_10083_length_1186_cov_0.976081_1_plen_66_part_10
MPKRMSDEEALTMAREYGVDTKESAEMLDNCRHPPAYPAKQIGTVQEHDTTVDRTLCVLVFHLNSS